MRNVIVIGGSGFIGTRLIQRLKNKKSDEIKIIDKAPSKAFPDLIRLIDVRSIEQLRDAIPNESLIINLAAEHRDNVRPLSLYDEVNVGGAKNICTIAREKSVKTIIFTSSVAVYGFAPIGTNESGKIDPFNDYGRTKYEAEQVYRTWQEDAADERTLVIIRPTVVFGEKNRGNVFSLLRQIASGKFVMVGDGLNRKSMAYVENVAAFLEYSMESKPGVYIYNYIDKPDFNMNQLVGHVKKMLNGSSEIRFRIPYIFGLLLGKVFDVAATVLFRNFSISSIRVKKFCSDSTYESAINTTDFTPPVNLFEAIERTVRYEFIENHLDDEVFYSE